MRHLKALMVEDRQDDTDLLVYELERAGYTVEYERVCTAATMAEALGRRTWDLIFSDYSMPGFSALDALGVYRESGLDLPFIIVSGTIGEDTAVEALKAGAHDFLVKGSLARLIPALERELREAQSRAAHRQSDAALRQSEHRFRLLVERMQELILVSRGEDLIYANPAAEAALGHAPGKLDGMRMPSLMHPEDRPLVMEAIARVMDGGHFADPRDFRWRRQDGTDLLVQVNCQPVIFDGGPAAMVLARDVTQQRKVESQLMVSDRMASVGMLAAGVAHEINNPLAVVLADLRFLTEELEDLKKAGAPVRLEQLAELDEPLQDATHAAGRVKEIVADLKLFSRAEQGELREPVDLKSVLEAAARMAANQVRHRAELVKAFAEVPPVLANEGRLVQVFLNLVVNAAQALPDGHAKENKVRLVTRMLEDGRVAAEVQDTGPGMAPEVLRKLFTPFFTTKPVGVGTGLGLSICHRIVTSLGGEIVVESVQGRGTTFRVILPIAPDDFPTAAAAAPQAATTAFRRGRVLVVDDEPLIRKVLERALSRAHAVTVASGGAEALAIIGREAPFDVIVCDLMMPEMTGADFHQALQRIAPEQAARIIFLSGGAFSPAARDFLEESGALRLEKPFDLDQLHAAVNDRIRGPA